MRAGRTGPPPWPTRRSPRAPAGPVAVLLPRHSALSCSVCANAPPAKSSPPRPLHQSQKRRRRHQHRPVFPRRTSATGSRPMAGTPPPARRSGTAARRPRSRWPSRSGAMRSFSSDFITIQSSSPRTSFGQLAPVPIAALAATVAVVGRAQPRARPRRLFLADEPQDLRPGRLP